MTATTTNTAAIELADQLDMSAYGFTLSALQRQYAKENGLVVVYGASDDLIEFEGAFRDEGSVYDGGTVRVDAEGVLPDNADDLDTEEERERYYYRKGRSKTIEALWCDEVNGGGFDWAYRTDIPHATFNVMDGDEPYCCGIVFALAELELPMQATAGGDNPHYIPEIGSLDAALSALDLPEGDMAAKVIGREQNLEADNDCGDACKI